MEIYNYNTKDKMSRTRQNDGKISRGGSYLYLISTALMFLWPKYYFLNILSVTTNPYMIFTLISLMYSIVILSRRSFAEYETKGIFKRHYLIICMFVFWWMWLFICDLLSEGQFIDVRKTAVYFVYVGAWFFIGIVINSKRWFYEIRFNLFFTIILIIAFFGLVEKIAGQNIYQLFNLSKYGAGSREDLNALVGVDILRGGSIRVRSLFSHPIIYGQVMAAMLPFAFEGIFSKNPRRIIMGIIMGASVLLSIYLCSSRSPLIMLATSVISFFSLYLFDFNKRSRIVLGVILLLCAFLAMPLGITLAYEVGYGTTQQEVNSSQARKIQMARGISALERSPVTGFGYSGEVYAATTSFVSGGLRIVSVDDYYLTVAMQSGLVGLIIFVLFELSIFAVGCFKTVKTKDDLDRNYGCALTSSVFSIAVGLTVVSITETIPILLFMSSAIISMRSNFQMREDKQLWRSIGIDPDISMHIGRA